MQFIKTITVLLLSLLFTSLTYANNFNRVSGARAGALGNNTATLVDVFSVNNNQAGIGFLKDFSFGVSAKNRFIFKELNEINASAIFPTKTGVFGLNVNYYGNKLYSEKKIGAAFGKSFGEKFSVGLQFDYLNISIQEYGNKHFFTFEVGLQYYIIKQLLIGAHINNPLRLTVDEETDEKLPTVMNFGFKYMPSNKLLILFEVEKDIDFKPVFKFGLEYNVVEKFSLRGGFNANPFTGSFGFGVNLKNIEIDAAIIFHPVLGISPQISLTYAFKKKEQ